MANMAALCRDQLLEKLTLNDEAAVFQIAMEMNKRESGQNDIEDITDSAFREDSQTSKEVTDPKNDQSEEVTEKSDYENKTYLFIDSDDPEETLDSAPRDYRDDDLDIDLCDLFNYSNVSDELDLYVDECVKEMQGPTDHFTVSYLGADDAKNSYNFGIDDLGKFDVEKAEKLGVENPKIFSAQNLDKFEIDNLDKQETEDMTKFKMENTNKFDNESPDNIDVQNIDTGYMASTADIIDENREKLNTVIAANIDTENVDEFDLENSIGAIYLSEDVDTEDADNVNEENSDGLTTSYFSDAEENFSSDVENGESECNFSDAIYGDEITSANTTTDNIEVILNDVNLPTEFEEPELSTQETAKSNPPELSDVLEDNENLYPALDEDEDDFNVDDDHAYKEAVSEMSVTNSDTTETFITPADSTNDVILSSKNEVEEQKGTSPVTDNNTEPVKDENLESMTQEDETLFDSYINQERYELGSISEAAVDRQPLVHYEEIDKFTGLTSGGAVCPPSPISKGNPYQQRSAGQFCYCSFPGDTGQPNTEREIQDGTRTAQESQNEVGFAGATEHPVYAPLCQTYGNQMYNYQDPGYCDCTHCQEPSYYPWGQAQDTYQTPYYNYSQTPYQQIEAGKDDQSLMHIENQPQPYVPPEMMQYPALHVSESGIITALLKGGVSVEMTLDRTIRLVNHQRKLVVATNGRGNCSCVVHPAAKIYQSNTTTDVEVFLGRKARMTTEYVVIGNNFKTYKFDNQSIEESTPDFHDLSRDLSVDYLFNSEAYGSAIVPRCLEVTAAAFYEYFRNGGCYVNVNGIKITQNANEDVTVTCGPKYLHLNYMESIVRLQTHFVEMDIESNWNIKVSRGGHSLNASHLGFVVANSNLEAGFDEENVIRAFSLPRRIPVPVGPRNPHRPGTVVRRKMNYQGDHREVENDHNGYQKQPSSV